MELKAFRRRRVQEAMKDSNVQILIASLPQNIAYLTGGYVSVGQNVLCSSQAYVAYLLPEGKLLHLSAAPRSGTKAKHRISLLHSI